MTLLKITLAAALLSGCFTNEEAQEHLRLGEWILAEPGVAVGDK
ncbi:MAG TPA: hypothetical protein VIT23_04785 [Terrimicrobiaceae bacterium]